MPFHVPPGEERTFELVKRDYIALARAGVVEDVFSASELVTWLGNFNTDEERYLAAKLMSAAVVRSARMIDSGLRQIVDILAPHYLRSLGLHDVRCLSEFERQLSGHRPTLPIRFMAVDGALLDRAAGNSGEAVMRRFTTKFNIGTGYRLRSDVESSFQSDEPRLLVLLDDLVGTGTQISSFLTRYRVLDHPNLRVVYMPLLATSEGCETTMQSFPRLTLAPIETLTPRSQFFHADHVSGNWIQDAANACDDVRRFYDALCDARAIGREGRYSMFLTVLMPDRYPNNTLCVYWKESATWRPLKLR